MDDSGAVNQEQPAVSIMILMKKDVMHDKKDTNAIFVRNEQ